MPIEKVGYRRLYDSMGCSIVNSQTLHLVFPLGQHHHVEIYMGAKPKFGIHIEKDHDDYLIPGSQARFGQYSYHGDATESSYPRSFFTEITCLRELEVPADLSETFHRNDPQANNELLQLVAKDEDEYRVVADLISGIIGLRFHPQFVMKLLNENFIALRETDHAITLTSSPIQRLEELKLSESGFEQISQLLPAIGTADEELTQSSGKILGWLLRAWIERDAISKFNSLFIPLEMVLEDTSGKIPEEHILQIEKIQELITTHAGEDKEQLKTFLEILAKRQQPSLSIVDRFTNFAKEANMPGWENDVAVFKKFYRIRNGLIHHGNTNIKLHIPIGEEIRALEDLSERYVNYALFGDTAVYQSEFQHRPSTIAEPPNVAE